MGLYAPPSQPTRALRKQLLLRARVGSLPGVPCTRVLVFCVYRLCGAPRVLPAPCGAGARQRCLCMCRAAVVGGQVMVERNARAVLWVDTLAVLQLLMTKSTADKVTELP